MLGVPGYAFHAVADLLHERPERGETLVDVRVVALDDGHRGHGLARNWLDFALFPLLDVECLGDFARRVVLDRREHQILFDAEHFRRDARKRLGNRLVDLPIALALPYWIHRRR